MKKEMEPGIKIWECVDRLLQIQKGFLYLVLSYEKVVRLPTACLKLSVSS